MQSKKRFLIAAILMITAFVLNGAPTFNEQYPEPAVYYFGSGKRLFQAKDYKGAMQNLQIAYKKNPDLIEARFYMGKIYYSRNLYSFALDEFNIVIKNKKKLTLKRLRYEAALLAAKCHFILGRKTDPDIDRNHHFIKMKRILSGMISDAKSTSNRLDRLNKNKVNWFFYHDYYLVRGYYILGRINRAINRHDLYVKQLQMTINHIRQLLQSDAVLSFKEKIIMGHRELISLYFLYVRAHHQRNQKLADKIKLEAKRRIIQWEKVKADKISKKEKRLLTEMVKKSKSYFSGAGQPGSLILYQNNNSTKLINRLNNRNTTR